MEGHGAEVDLVRVYLSEVGRHALLDRRDEERLGTAVQAGRFAARRLAGSGDLDPGERAELEQHVAEGARAEQEFVEANLRLVVSIAKRYQGPGVDLMDLVQAGNIGLLRAVKGFDGRQGNRFSTYATWWIRHAVMHELGDVGRTVRLPAMLRQQISELARARDRLRESLGREATIAELASHVGLAESRVSDLLLAAQDIVSLSRPVGDAAGDELGDFLVDPHVDPGESVAGESQRRGVRDLLDHLGASQATVLRLRYGLDGTEPRSLRDVGAELGISGERVRQIEVRALHRLRRDGAALELGRAS